ncbi:MAG: PilZ domain-containing protein [Vulcanimicrobiota bacterium]
MLQKIFGYRVELVEHSEEYTVVKANRPMKVGDQIPVKVSDANGQRTPAVPMFVMSCRECDGGEYLVTGRFLVEHPDLSGFEIPAGINTDSALRSAPRVNCHLCVISRDLPGYRVMTIDISEGGLQVEAPSRVALGNSVLLRLEFDTERLPAIQASATVAWCAKIDRGRYRIGLQFKSLDDGSKEVISTYRKIVDLRATTDIAYRTVKGDAELNGMGESEETVAMPTLHVLQWKNVPISESLLMGYRRCGKVLQVRLQRGEAGLRYSDYAFTDLKSVRDLMDCDPLERPVCEFRFAEVSDGFFRFQLLDSMKRPLLEVEARGCAEQHPEQN